MIRLQIYSYRFAEQVLNSRLLIKQEIEQILQDPGIDVSELSRPKFNKVLDFLDLVDGMDEVDWVDLRWWGEIRISDLRFDISDGV